MKSVKRKIFLNMAAAVVLTAALTFLMTSVLLYFQNYEEMKHNVASEARLYKKILNVYHREFLTDNNFGNGDYRITLIDRDGTVLYDNVESASNMENHLERKEVQGALKNNFAESTRKSVTLGYTTYYYALKLQDGTIIRVAGNIQALWIVMMTQIPWLIVVTLVALFVSVLVARFLTNKLVDPLVHLNLEEPMENDVYEEMSPLLQRINHQNEQIASQVQALQEQKEEYLAITENMSEGLIVTNRNRILSINRVAQTIFHINQEQAMNQPLLGISRDINLHKIFDEALAGRNGSCTMELRGKSYQILANPVYQYKRIRGTVLFIMDVTEHMATEKIRQEFTANVSHELKTPLMSISGYAEIIENGLVRQEDIPEFVGRIHSEAKRLATLIEDIINLSKLDEGVLEQQKEVVDLYQLIGEIQNHLEERMKKRSITFHLDGRVMKVRGVRQVLYEMFFNLVDNAIKYNKEHGEIYVKVNRDMEGVYVSVADTGLGIPEEDQNRIFERFYRVDKSHSREIGGTGLGLSIVKHGVSLHKATIQVESQFGKGTRFTIHFPVETRI